ncbi:hypothetical protein O6H91_05G086000 [Diphasiastrum complanatum]|nr:hypothetical protein O6H91_05G086000 [Diphasiastrum complanatum]
MRSADDYLPYSGEGSYPYVVPRPARYGSYPVVYSDQYPFMVEDPAYPMEYYYGSPYSMESRRRYHPPFVSAAPVPCRGRAPWQDPALDGAYYPRERGIEYLPVHEFVYPLRRFPSEKASKIPAEEFRPTYYPAHPEPQRRYASPQFVPLEDVLRDALQNQGKAQSIEKRSSPGQYVLLDDALRKALQYPRPPRGTEDDVSGERFDRPVILVPSNYLRNAEDAKILPPKSDSAPIADHSSPEASKAYVPLKIPGRLSSSKEDNVANSQRQAEPIYILGPDSLLPVRSNPSHGKLDGKAEGSNPELGYPIVYIPASSMNNSLNEMNGEESKPFATQITDTSQPKASVRLIPVTQEADGLKPLYLHTGRHAEADSDRNTRSSNKDQSKHVSPVEGQPDETQQLKSVQDKKEKLQAKQEHSRPRKIFSPETAAVLIQSIYRGYVVRRSEPLKYLREIAKVRSKSKDLQAQVCKQEDFERICSNTKERLKLTEGIMALLLQLDVIQGVHPVVREFRKSAARELIQLQETVDNAIKQSNNQQGSLTANVEDVTTVDHQTVGTCTVEKIASENEAGDVETPDQSIPAKVDAETFIDDHKSRVVLKDLEKEPPSDEILEKIVEEDNRIPNGGEDEEKDLKTIVTPADIEGLKCSEAREDADNQQCANAEDHPEANQLDINNEREDTILSAQPTSEETMDQTELSEENRKLTEQMTAYISIDEPVARYVPSCGNGGHEFEVSTRSNRREADDSIDYSLVNEANILENVKQVSLNLSSLIVPPEQSALETYNVAEEREKIDQVSLELSSLETCNVAEEQEKIDHEVILETQSPSKEATNISEDGRSHQLAAEQGESELVIADDEGTVRITDTDMVDGGNGLSKISVAEDFPLNSTNSVIARDMKDPDQPLKDANVHETGKSSSEEMVQNSVLVIEADHVRVANQFSDSCGSNSTEDEENMESTGGTKTQIESTEVCASSAAERSDKHDGMCQSEACSGETNLDTALENPSVDAVHSEIVKSDTTNPVAKDSEILDKLKERESSQSISNEAMSLSAAMEDGDICVAGVHERLENVRDESFEQDLSKLHLSTVDMQEEKIKTENSFCNLFGKPQLPEEDEDSKMQNAEEGENVSVGADKARHDEKLDKDCDNLTAIAKDCLEEVYKGSQAEEFEGKGSEFGNNKLHNKNDDDYAMRTLLGLDCKCNIADEDVKNICYTDNRVDDETSNVELQPNLLTSPADSAPNRNSTVETKIEDTTNVDKFEANVPQDANSNKSESSNPQLMQVISEENRMLKSLVNELMHCSKIQALSILHLQERLVRLENSLSLRKPKKIINKSKGKISNRSK